ncbi:MAG: recombinase family protein [Bryobacteraceae bacterium]|nr:recombinase family protein [Bryobacteraceae bacterium]
MPAKPKVAPSKKRQVFGQARKPVKMLRVGIYARVSTLDQQTLPMQIRACASMLPGCEWTVVRQVKEAGSGAAARPLRGSVMEAARRRDIDVVLCGGWTDGADRWPTLVTSLQELTELGVGLVSIAEAIDLTTPTGREMAGMLAVFVQVEREMMRERVRAGLDHARQQGMRLGRPPSAAHQAADVRTIYQGLSKSEIARRLDIGRTSVRRLLWHIPDRNTRERK